MYQILGWSSPCVKRSWVKSDGPKTTWVKYDGLVFGYYELHDPVLAACVFSAAGGLEEECDPIMSAGLTGSRLLERHSWYHTDLFIANQFRLLEPKWTYRPRTQRP
jgi:hypothetical protein